MALINILLVDFSSGSNVLTFFIIYEPITKCLSQPLHLPDTLMCGAHESSTPHDPAFLQCSECILRLRVRLMGAVHGAKKSRYRRHASEPEKNF